MVWTMSDIIEGKCFKGINFSETEIVRADFENCSFVNCIFLNSDLAKINFTECEFDNCNLAMAKICRTSFQTVKFLNCKLLGLHFSDCNPFLLSVSFEGCHLQLASFYKLKLKGARFKNCNLQEADFTESDLTGSIFDNCDLAGAIFQFTLLEKSDFRTSFNYSFDPELNRIKKAKFSLAGIPGLLGKYNIEIE